MIREHKQPGGNTPLPPFSENLVFWAPLTQGDLSDHISGETGTTSQGASVVWDSSKGMYLLGFDTTMLGHNCTALRYTSNEMQQNLNGIQNGCTVYMECEEVSYNGRTYGVSRWFSCDCMYDVWERSPRMNLLIDGARMNQSSISSGIHKCVCTYSNAFVICYKDGVQVRSGSWDNCIAPISLGICDKNGHSTSTSSGYNTSSMYIYAKDVRVYNRVLSASEVTQL